MTDEGPLDGYDYYRLKQIRITQKGFLLYPANAGSTVTVEMTSNSGNLYFSNCTA